MKYAPPLLLLIAFLALTGSAAAQEEDSLRYYRLHLGDKGTPARTLRPDDPFWQAATAHLTPRAFARRAKVLPPDSLVSTLDLPVYPPYLEAIRATGVTIAQQSRWLNTVMVIADSTQHERLLALPFLDSVRTVRTRKRAGDPFGRRIATPRPLKSSTEIAESACITNMYGLASTQNRLIGIDVAHGLGIAGEGVLIGVLDAGFDWRNHESLQELNVIAEYDFVNHDSLAADVEGEDAESHGTTVMSMIGGMADGELVGGAIHAGFLLAKTEDIRSERHVEEDNWVAGIEWMEAMGADVTNTSLSYTTFDSPEQPHLYSELNGHTAFASRGLNQAVRFGMICVIAAGNDGAKSYRYLGVPAEADSSIAAAAVDSTGSIAGFSSRWFSNSSRIKPDVAAMGVANWGANHAGQGDYLTGQGTSYAAPMTTSAIALLLSARPSLRPYEVRSLLYRTSDHATNPDTAYGYGVISLDRAFTELSRTLPVVGYPLVQLHGEHISIAAGVRFHNMITASGPDGRTPAHYLSIELNKVGSAARAQYDLPQPSQGTARWYLPAMIGGEAVTVNDRLEITFIDNRSGDRIRYDTLSLNGNDFAWSAGTTRSLFAKHSVLCDVVMIPTTSIEAAAIPNPFASSTVIQFQTSAQLSVSLAVYDVLGREVQRLIDEVTMQPGFHTAYFQADGIPSGAYFYRLRVGDETYSGRMVHLH